jgi:hypothetical protein
MYIYVTTAKGTRTCKKDKDSVFMENPQRRIKKGEKCLVISNGAFGQLAQYDNYKKEIAIQMLENLIKELRS